MVGSAMAREAPPGECRKGWKKEDQLAGYFSRSKRGDGGLDEGDRGGDGERWSDFHSHQERSRALFSHMSCFPLLQVLFLRPPLFIQSLWLLFSPL